MMLQTPVKTTLKTANGFIEKPMSILIDTYYSIQHFLHVGGAVLWSIFIIMLLLWTLIIERLIFFTIIFPQFKMHIIKQWQAYQQTLHQNSRPFTGDSCHDDSCYDDSSHDDRSHDYQLNTSQKSTQYFRTIIIRQAELQAQRFLPLIKILVVLSPLLGLLGTVSGMVQVFDTLAIAGISSAKAIAAGVYKATIPTMAGMVVALSGLFAIGYLQRYAQRQSEWLKEQLTT